MDDIIKSSMKFFERMGQGIERQLSGKELKFSNGKTKKFRAAVDRVVGVLPKDEQLVVEEMERRFLTQSAIPNFLERKKTREELDILNLADRATNEVLHHYEKATFSIPPRNIHVLDGKDQTDDTALGMYRARWQSVFVRSQQNKLTFFWTVFHEMLHFKSYYAVQAPVQKHGPSLEDYRMGFTAHSRDIRNTYFYNLNEAITEELTRRFAKNFLNQEVLKMAYIESQRRIAKINENAKRDGRPALSDDVYTVLAAGDQDSTSQPTREDEMAIRKTHFHYEKDRAALNQLCKKLSQRCPKDFPHPEVAFDAFAKAMFDGKLLPLGRVIDKTFGVGAFRRIGETGNDTKELKKIIESL